ncbi:MULTISPECIES: hypothetical protein [unclassified Micromonospora]|uniref:hypothetical protein n=1 Tax=unclassified Micromonospora TaxID=2617518 RepID=UPI00363D488A
MSPRRKGERSGFLLAAAEAAGSHNYSNAALRENDEALLRIQSATIHDQYRPSFWALRDAAVPVS